jgi:uridine phosphorylase
MTQPPLFDFDPDPQAVIEPSRYFQAGTIPEHVVLTFFSESHRALVEAEQAPVLAHLGSLGLRYPIHGIQRQGRTVAFFRSYVGAAGAGAFLEELIALGGRKFMVCGGAGVLDSAVAQGHLLLPTCALRDEGTSYHYLPADDEAKPGAQAVAALEAALTARKVPYLECRTWTTDGVYRETKAKVAARKAAGCLSVEMEAAAFFAIAQFRGVQLAQLLYAGDDVSGEAWDHRDWDKNMGVREMMLELCFEAVLGVDSK